MPVWYLSSSHHSLFLSQTHSTGMNLSKTAFQGVSSCSLEREIQITFFIPLFLSLRKSGIRFRWKMCHPKLHICRTFQPASFVVAKYGKKISPLFSSFDEDATHQNTELLQISFSYLIRKPQKCISCYTL